MPLRDKFKRAICMDRSSKGKVRAGKLVRHDCYRAELMVQFGDGTSGRTRRRFATYEGAKQWLDDSSK